MPRPRQRACLEQGLKLDINKLNREGLFHPGEMVGPRTICWTNGCTGEISASAMITAHAQSDYGGWFRIQMDYLDQWIDLVAQPRHFGGRQWYFRSPITHRCSVLWKPPGANRFCGRHEWDGRVAYASQFDTPIDRAHRGKARIKAKLIGTLDPNEWELPPKPKWMRWPTYEALERNFDKYEARLHRIAFQRLGCWISGG